MPHYLPPNLTTPLHCYHPETQKCFLFVPAPLPEPGYVDTLTSLLVAAYTASTGILATYILNYAPTSWKDVLISGTWTWKSLDHQYIFGRLIPSEYTLPTFDSWNDILAAVSILATFLNTLVSLAPYLRRCTKLPKMAGLLGGGSGGALGGITDTAGGLTSGLAGDGGALSGATDLAGGLGGGLLGSGQGLNLAGLVGVGSDDPALLDLNPTEKKTVKAARAQEAAKRKQQRQQQLKQIQEAVQKQGGRPTLEQELAQTKLQDDQKADETEETKVNKVLDSETPSKRGNAGPVGNLTGQNGPLAGATKGVGGLTEAAGGLTGQNGVNGAAGGLTSAAGALPGGDALGSVTGGLGGLTGGLLGGGEGLNVAGIVGVGSDDPALLDLNPAEKKEAKFKKVQELQKEKARNAAQKKALQDAVRSQGGQATAEQQKAWQELEQKDAAIAQSTTKLQNSIAQDDRDIANGVTNGRGGAAGPITSTNNQNVGGFADTTGGAASKAGCLCLAPPGPGTIPPPSLIYAYLAPAYPVAGQYPYVLTFANAQVAQQWYQGVSGSGVQRVTPQWYTYQHMAPFPISQDPRFQGSPIGGQMMATRVNPNQCSPLLPPQTADGYLVPAQASHVYVANATCSPQQGGGQDIGIYQPQPNANGTKQPSVWPPASGGGFGPSNTGGFTNSGQGNEYAKQPSGYVPGQSSNFNPGQNGQQNPAQPGTFIPGQAGGYNPSNNSSIPPNQQGTAYPGANGTYYPGQGPYNAGQSGDYYPGTNNNNTFPSQPSKPRYTLEDAARDRANALKSQGDARPTNEIYEDALGDLKGSCCGPSGPLGQQQAPGQQLPGQYSAGPQVGGQGVGQQLPGQPSQNRQQFGQQQQPSGLGGLAGGLPGIGGLAGGLTSGILGGGQGLNVAGIAGIGSDQDALLDISPAEKQKAKQAKAQELAQQSHQVQQKIQQLQQQRQQQGGQFTPQQQAEYNQAVQMLNTIGQKQQAQAAGLDPGITSGLTQGLPMPNNAVGGLAQGLPGGNALGGGLGGAAGGLPGGLDL